MRVLRVLSAIAIAISAASCTPSAPKSTSSEGHGAAEEQTEEGALEEDNLEEGVLVSAPIEGSPEAVIQGLIAAAMYPDEEAGWKVVRELLHSSISAPHALKGYREMNYAASRRKVALFTPDDTKPHFRVVKRTTPSDDKVKLFIHNEKSMPTPCTLKRDADAQGAWRIYVCSL